MIHEFYRRGAKVSAPEVHDPSERPGGHPGHHAGSPDPDVAIAEGLTISYLTEFEMDRLRSLGWITYSVLPEDSVVRPERLIGVERLADAEEGLFIRDTTEQVARVTDHLVLKFAENFSVPDRSALLQAHNLDTVRPLFLPNLVEVKTTDGTNAMAKSVEVHEATNRSQVVYVEPVLIYITDRSFDVRHRPNDPGFHHQWQWEDPGSGRFGVSAEAAWDITMGDRPDNGRRARIALIDRGFHHNHEDLAANIDAASGYFRRASDNTRDLNTSIERDLRGMLHFAHGSFCAGQAGGIADDGFGMCGIAPRSNLILVALSDPRISNPLELARAFAYAADPQTEDEEGVEGADVISCPEGPNAGRQALWSVVEDAIVFATETHQVPIFWSVANNMIDVEEDEALCHPNVICVGSSSKTGQRVRECANGPRLDLLAPGDLVHNVKGQFLDHGPDSGTSFAAPIAAGIAALAMSAAPGPLTVNDIRQLMKNGCEVPAGHDTDTDGAGVVNAAKTLSLIEDPQIL